jgi:hypothetical protein
MENSPSPLITDGVEMPGGVGYDDSHESSTVTDQGSVTPMSNTAPMPNEGAAPADLPLPPQSTSPMPPADPENSAPGPNGASYPTTNQFYNAKSTAPSAANQTAARPHNPPRRPVFLRNSSQPNNPQPAAAQPDVAPSGNGLIGPVGYDNQ